MVKVLTIVGTRPELIKLSLVIKELDKCCDHILVHSGQNYDYELNEVFFKDLGIRKPDYFLNCAKGSASATIASVIQETDVLLTKEKPEAVLLYGDTNSCLSAISVKKHKIPLFHMEAGNRCFDERVPEEVNRRIIDHISDINMPLTEHARKYLIQEGIPAQSIIKTGSCMPEILEEFKDSIAKSTVLKGMKLTKSNYFVLSAHREENVDKESTLKSLNTTVNEIAKVYKCPIVFSIHPRTQDRLSKLKNIKWDSQVILNKPLGFFDYVHLQLNAKCVVSDSGTLSEESGYLNFPAILARESHERPEGFDEGVLMMAKIEPKSLLHAIDVTLKTHDPQMKYEIEDYKLRPVSKIVTKAILSYIGWVNRTKWQRWAG